MRIKFRKMIKINVTLLHRNNMKTKRVIPMYSQRQFFGKINSHKNETSVCTLDININNEVR